MKIGFDAKRLFLNYTGLGNYSRFIVNGLIENDSISNNNYLLFSPRINFNSETNAYFNNKQIKIITPSFPFNVSPFSNIWRSYSITKENNFKTEKIKENSDLEYIIWKFNDGKFDNVFLFGSAKNNFLNLLVYSNKWSEDEKIIFLEKLYQLNK